MKERVVIYIRNYIVSPSGYYRVMQYLEAMKVDFVLREQVTYKVYDFYIRNKNKGCNYALNILLFFVVYIRVFCFLIIDFILRPKTIIVSREILPHYLVFPIGFFIKKIASKSRLIWDFDDHILYGHEISEKEFYLLSKYSYKIVVTNLFLKETVDVHFEKKIAILPTTDGDMRNLDLNKISKARENTFQYSVKMVWVATAANIPNLLKVLSILDVTAGVLKKTNGKQLYLSIVSSCSVEFECKYLIIDNIRWTHDKAIKEMCNAHIGIMPLVNSIFSCGKGGFKLIQYMAVGLPVLASDVGFNRTVVSRQCGVLIDDDLETDGWKDALLAITIDWGTYLNYSKCSYLNWKNNFSFEKNLSFWSDMLKSL